MGDDVVLGVARVEGAEEDGGTFAGAVALDAAVQGGAADADAI